MISAELAKQKENALEATSTSTTNTTAGTAASPGPSTSEPQPIQPHPIPQESQPRLITEQCCSSSTSPPKKTTSASILSGRSTVRPTRKTPAFSIVVPERETVAAHVQNVGSFGSRGLGNNRNGNNNSNHCSPGVGSSCSLSPIPGSSANFNGAAIHHTAMVTPSGYHEHTFGASAFQATRLLPLLYLGNEGDACMPNELRHRNIKRVLNVAFDCATQDYERYGIKVLHLPLRDCGDEDIGSHFENCCKWIHEGITNNEGVIIHCRLGVSRSATIAIAYLMTYGIAQPTRIMSQQYRFRVVPIDQQAPQGQCRTCAKYGRRWLHYEDNAERIMQGEFHTHSEECPKGSGKCFTDYGDVFTYVSMRREHISPNIGFAMQLRKLNVEHGFRDFLSEMSPGPSDDYCCSIESVNNIAPSCSATPVIGGSTTGITPVTMVSMSTSNSTHQSMVEGLHAILSGARANPLTNAHGSRGSQHLEEDGGVHLHVDSPLHNAPRFGDAAAKPAIV